MAAPRRFLFERDTFAFPNELLWEYLIDHASGKMQFKPRVPKPAYANRCFVLTRAARVFFDHARFEPDAPHADAETYRRLVRAVLARDARKTCAPGREVVIPGFASLRDFSRAHEHVLKEESGGAWRSYVLRSHWRMIFPVTRPHQSQMAAQLSRSISRYGTAMVHIFRFPALTINHGIFLYAARETSSGIDFDAYDPNDSHQPVTLSYDRSARTFSLPANRYWAGGRVNVIEIFRTWLL